MLSVSWPPTKMNDTTSERWLLREMMIADMRAFL